jgi:hypothetical protein
MRIFISIVLLLWGVSMLVWSKRFTFFSYWSRHLGEFGVFGMKDPFPDLCGWESKWIQKTYAILNIALGTGLIISAVLIYFSDFK